MQSVIFPCISDKYTFERQLVVEGEDMFYELGILW